VQQQKETGRSARAKKICDAAYHLKFYKMVIDNQVCELLM